jgi:hypothetical protein
VTEINAEQPPVREEWLKISTDNLSEYTVEVAGETWLNFDKLFASGQHPVFSSLSLEFQIRFPDAYERRFPKGVSFVDVHFLDNVLLNKTEFNGPLYFWDCRFDARADFFRCKVTASEVYGRAPGEVNFSYCLFTQDISIPRPVFARAEFAGECFFHRTIFPNGVNFAGAKFTLGAIFEGAESDICISKKVLEATVGDDALEIIKMMDRKRILQESAYSDLHYNFDWLIMSDTDLKRRLEEARGTLPSPESPSNIQAIDRIISLWCERYSQTMFGVPFGARHVRSLPDVQRITTFRGASFGSDTAFRHVNLSWCLFQGTNLGEVEFLVAHWGKEACGVFSRWKHNPFKTERLILCDEIELARNGSSKEHMVRNQELAELYRELRITYDKEGDSTAARDFYYGELEMDRLSRIPVIWRYFSLSNLYRLFAGYSKRDGLALFWLFFFVFILFPLIFARIGWREHQLLFTEGRALLQQLDGASKAHQAEIVDAIDNKQDSVAKANDYAWGRDGFWSPLGRAETVSLQASTFLATATQNNAMTAAGDALLPDRCSGFSDAPCSDKFKKLQGLETRRHFTEGFERLLVFSQLGLFLLSLRSKFQRAR